jgi:hypothetical protein
MREQLARERGREIGVKGDEEIRSDHTERGNSELKRHLGFFFDINKILDERIRSLSTSFNFTSEAVTPL